MAAETEKVLPNTTSEAILNFIDIANRITSATKREGPSYLVAQIKSNPGTHQKNSNQPLLRQIKVAHQGCSFPKCTRKR